ncbi:unnamed protein product, partial [Brassica oleracea var. botrytis]
IFLLTCSFYFFPNVNQHFLDDLIRFNSVSLLLSLKYDRYVLKLSILNFKIPQYEFFFLSKVLGRIGCNQCGGAPPSVGTA